MANYPHPAPGSRYGTKFTGTGSRRSSTETKKRVNHSTGLQNDHREVLKKEAEIRNAKWSMLSPEEQLKALDKRLGVGIGAEKQRAKLAEDIKNGRVSPKLNSDSKSEKKEVKQEIKTREPEQKFKRGIHVIDITKSPEPTPAQPAQVIRHIQVERKIIPHPKKKKS